MSGVNRAVKAEITHAGKTGEAAMKLMSPENLRAETGRSIHSISVDPKKVSNDMADYLGKTGKNATPKK